GADDGNRTRAFSLGSRFNPVTGVCWGPLTVGCHALKSPLTCGDVAVGVPNRLLPSGKFGGGVPGELCQRCVIEMDPRLGRRIRVPRDGPPRADFQGMAWRGTEPL